MVKFITVFEKFINHTLVINEKKSGATEIGRLALQRRGVAKPFRRTP